MPRLNDYVQGVHEKSPQPRFLPLMTENLEILGTLTENMRHLVEQAAMVYKSLEPPLFLKDPEFGTESSGDGHRHHSVENRIEDDLFIIASVVDAMEREFELFVSLLSIDDVIIVCKLFLYANYRMETDYWRKNTKFLPIPFDVK